MPYPLRSLPAPCVFAAVLTAGLALLPARTQACTYGEVVIQASYPRWGSVDVPTNVVLFLYGPDLRSADDLRLVDATSGESVPFEAQAAPSGLDLTPLDALASNRTYQLAGVQSPGPLLEFTTGSTPAAPGPALPAPKFDATVFEYFLGSCGLTTGLCLEVADSPGTTLEVRVGEEVLMDSGAPWPLSRAYGGPIGDSDCVEVRLRDALGQRSQPTVACGAAVRRVELEGDDFNQGVNCANYSDYVKPSGCALTRVGSAEPGLAGLGLALVIGLAALRRGKR